MTVVAMVVVVIISVEQEVVLSGPDSRVLEFRTRVQWAENRRLLKVGKGIGRGNRWTGTCLLLQSRVNDACRHAARDGHGRDHQVEFPVSVRSDTALFETQFGCLTRPTHTNTRWGEGEDTTRQKANREDCLPA